VYSPVAIIAFGSDARGVAGFPPEQGLWAIVFHSVATTQEILGLPELAVGAGKRGESPRDLMGDDQPDAACLE
jgi:hypothetical protein